MSEVRIEDRRTRRENARKRLKAQKGANGQIMSAAELKLKKQWRMAQTNAVVQDYTDEKLISTYKAGIIAEYPVFRPMQPGDTPIGTLTVENRVSEIYSYEPLKFSETDKKAVAYEIEFRRSKAKTPEEKNKWPYTDLRDKGIEF